MHPTVHFLLILLLLSTSANAQTNTTADSQSQGSGGDSFDSDSRSAVSYVWEKPIFTPKTDVLGRKLMSIPYSPTSSLKLNCRISPSGKFVAWVQNFRVVCRELQLIVPLNTPNAYGTYKCVATTRSTTSNPKKYSAIEFSVAEMPNERDEVTEIPVKQNSDTTVHCKLDAGSENYQWFRYNDQTYRFEEISGETSRNLLLPYSTLVKNRQAGFTFYKCQLAGNYKSWKATNYEAFKLNKEPYDETVDGKLIKKYEVTMRPTNIDVAAMPIKVTPKSTVSFECHKVGGSGSAAWSFRRNSTVSPSDYRSLNDSHVEIRNEANSSILTVKECGVQDAGYYRCSIGGVVQYAFLNIEVIVPTIHKFSRGIYDMAEVSGDVNEIECEIPLGGYYYMNNVVWHVVPPRGSGSSFYISIGNETNGFKATVKDKLNNRLIVISFNDSDAMNAYRLECRLGEELDFVTLKYSRKPVITQEISQYEQVFQFVCNPNGLTSPSIYIKDEIDSKLIPRDFHFTESYSRHLYYYTPTSMRTKWLTCSGETPDGQRVYSNVIPTMLLPSSLQLSVDGAVLDPNKPHAKVVGRPTEITCKLSYSKYLKRYPVELHRNDVIVNIKPQTSDNKTFTFVLTTPSFNDAGTYQCKHIGSQLWQKAFSNNASLNWCNTDQFICDGSCKNASVMCDGKKDCTDGIDELSVLCNECKPNEVPCGKLNGKDPHRKCVLKHWLCDGQDDCENGYDEYSPVAKSWCTKTCMNGALACEANSTCCKSKLKCILRAYECDRKNQCADSPDDENNCCELKLVNPEKPMQLKRSEGSRVTMTCRATGMERPTISWRCNLGHLRDPKRMTESNIVEKRNENGTYTVLGTLVILNFTKTDECIYNCEAITKCKRVLSPEINLLGKL